MRVLVTGGGGFIGSHTAAALKARGHEVAHLQRAEIELSSEAATAEAVARLEPEGAVLLGWVAEPGRYLHDEEANSASLRSARQVLAGLEKAGAQRVAIAGTCLEAMPKGAHDSAYARGKRAFHADAAALGERMAIGCGHIFWVYGPGEDRRRAVPSVATRLLRGEEVDVTAGTQRRDFSHVVDVAAGLCAILEGVVGFAAMDICSGTEIEMRDLFSMIEREVNGVGRLNIGARPSVDDDTFAVSGDPSALRALGWVPRWDLPQGIADTVAWWRRELRVAP